MSLCAVACTEFSAICIKKWIKIFNIIIIMYFKDNYAAFRFYEISVYLVQNIVVVTS